MFDAEAASFVCEFIEYLTCSNGAPFRLMDWQREAVTEFYGQMIEAEGDEADPAGNYIRRYQYLYLEIAKKNGKSELAAALGVYHLYADGEINGEVYVVAADRDNAGIVYSAAKWMVEHSPALMKRSRIVDSTKTIYDTVSGSKLKVLSSEAYSKHGYKPSCVIFDELHAQPNRDLWDVMTFGAGDAREQPVWIVLTTAGDDPDRKSIGWEVHEKALSNLRCREGRAREGDMDDPRWLPIIYGLGLIEDEDELKQINIYDEDLWRRCNPSIGKTVKLSTIRAEAQEARRSEAAERLFRWLRLNQWIATHTVGWIPVTIYDKTQWNPEGCKDWRESVNLLRGKKCFGGGDLSKSTDLTAFTLLFPPQEGLDKWVALFTGWIPLDDIEARERADHAPYRDWIRAGFIRGCPGDVIDYEDVIDTIMQAVETEAKRNKLIMDTLSGAYEDAATAFYENNKQAINARRNQATLSEVTAKLGDTSALVKNRLWEMFGAAEDGSYRGGSALEWLKQKADAFSSWVLGLDMETLTTQFDQKFAGAVNKAKDALQWCKDNADKLKGALKSLATAFVTVKVVKFTGDLISSISTVWEFIKTVRELIAVKSLETYCWVRSTAVVTANKMALLANKAAGAVRWLTDQTVTLMANAVQWTVDTAAIAANKAALLGHKIVGGATWLLAQAAALGAASAAWVHNTAMMAVNKAGQLASAAATGIATGATTALTAAQWALNAAFVATPIGWIVLGLGAVVAAGVALYKNWDTIKQYAGQLWTKVKETFGGIKDSIVGAFNSAKEAVSGFFSWLDQKIESIPLLGSLYSGGKSLIGGAVDLLAGNALGTSYWRGGLTRVNERGGEIMNLPSGTQIIPHDISARMAGGPRVTVHVTVAGNVIGNEQYADELGEHIADKLLRAIENM